MRKWALQTTGKAGKLWLYNFRDIMPADLYKGSFMGENYKRKSIRNKVIIL